MAKVSIITVNYNNNEGLQKTFDSVFAQSYTDFDYIVIDGGSNDGSRELIESNKDKLAYWLSEKDRGIYDAMNKGIDNAKAEYLLFLNSGDYLYNKDVLREVAESGLDADIVYGDIIWDTDGVQSENRFPDKISFDFFSRGGFLPHQGSFIRKSLFNAIGNYDVQYRIIADWVFFLIAICKYNCSYKHIHTFISICGRDGISCKPESWQSIAADRQKAMETNFPAFVPDYKNLDSMRSELNKLKKRWLFRLTDKLQKFSGR